MTTRTLGACHNCGRTWNALGQAHCKECHEQFNSTAAFDRHRTGKPEMRECIPVAQFATLNEKTGLPLLVSTMRADGDVWVTALREIS